MPEKFDIYEVYSVKPEKKQWFPARDSAEDGNLSLRDLVRISYTPAQDQRRTRKTFSPPESTKKETEPSLISEILKNEFSTMVQQFGFDKSPEVKAVPRAKSRPGTRQSPAGMKEHRSSLNRVHTAPPRQRHFPVAKDKAAGRRPTTVQPQNPPKTNDTEDAREKADILKQKRRYLWCDDAYIHHWQQSVKSSKVNQMLFMKAMSEDTLFTYRMNYSTAGHRVIMNKASSSKDSLVADAVKAALKDVFQASAKKTNAEAAQKTSNAEQVAQTAK